MVWSGCGEREGNVPHQGCQNFPLKWAGKLREGTCCCTWGGKSKEKGMRNAQINGVPVPKLKPQGKRTPSVRSRGTVVLLEMKQLLLLLQEGKKLMFSKPVQRSCKGKCLDIEGDVKSGEGF